MDFENKNLLIIAGGFPDKTSTCCSGIFVKEQLNYLKDYFKEVIVISPVTVDFIDLLRERSEILKNYEFENVKVYFPRVSYFKIPYVWVTKIPYFSTKIEDDQLKVVDKLIYKEKIKFDLIHCHFTYPAGYIGAKLKEKYGKPLVLTVHEDSEWLIWEYYSNKNNLYEAWKKADALIRVNQIDIPLLKKYNKNTINIPNGFNHIIFRSKDNRELNIKLPTNKKILLSVGSLDGRKGQKYLIQAMAKVVNARKDVLCLIIGEGSLKEELQKQINNLNLDEYVKLIGGKPYNEIPLWMNACDIFVLPSLTESFGIVQIEAMACGKPVVATRNGGSEEIIVNDDLGFLVETKNSEQLADAILKALNNKWDSDYIVKYAEQFTWDKNAEKTLEVYKLICG